MPPMSTRITAGYVSGERSRARYAPGEPTTWYPDQFGSPIDLLAGGRLSPPRRAQYSCNHDHNHDCNHHIHNSNPTFALYIDRPDRRKRSPSYRLISYDRRRSRSPPYSRHARYSFYLQGYASEYAPQPLHVYLPSSSTACDTPEFSRPSGTNTRDCAGDIAGLASV
jgi:hypothetical protein